VTCAICGRRTCARRSRWRARIRARFDPHSRRIAGWDQTDCDQPSTLGRARLREWVETSAEGLDTLVGEDGARLSGGQRQRLVVARALLADTAVLILDEPTAQLDPDTAEALVTDVLAAADGRSVLLVTHRPEGLDLVDEIVSLPAR
jgi:ATP-binding cassette subfamily C protein CydCD